MYLKAILLLATGLLASIILLIDQPHLRTAMLLTIAVWAFCRAYYFAFYVVEKYIDPSFRFAGLLDLLKYLSSRRSLTGNAGR